MPIYRLIRTKNKKYKKRKIKKIKINLQKRKRLIKLVQNINQ